MLYRAASGPGARFYLALVSLAGGVGCAVALPEHPVQRALVRDLTRVVDVRSRVGGWLVDETEVLGALPDAMRSVCQVERTQRTLIASWLDSQIEAEGGDVVARWRERGKDLDEVSDLLRLTRTRLVLRRASEWADLGRCPFWLEPSPDFAGVNTQGDRFILTVEGGGRFTPEFILGEVKYGAGGGGRLLVGYGLGETWSLSTGFEMSSTARFSNLQLGEQSELPELVLIMAFPVVLRFGLGLSTFLELETGVMGYFDEGSANPIDGQVSGRFHRGVHLGVAIGATYLRLERGVIPKFSFAITMDHAPGGAGLPTITQLGIGLRTGVDLSRWRRF
jgi:hypothetical protein